MGDMKNTNITLSGMSTVRKFVFMFMSMCWMTEAVQSWILFDELTLLKMQRCADMLKMIFYVLCRSKKRDTESLGEVPISLEKKHRGMSSSIDDLLEGDKDDLDTATDGTDSSDSGYFHTSLKSEIVTVQ